MFCEIPEFGRCCFCLPLRRGVLVFGYLNMLFSIFMVGLYSYMSHGSEASTANTLVYHGVSVSSLAGWCVAVYCVELVVNCLLVFGAHAKKLLYLKIFYYYAITTTLAALALQIVDFTNMPHPGRLIEMGVFVFAGFAIQIYLLFLVRSLMKKMEIGEDHSYDNQLHNIVSGDGKVENGVYNNCTTVAPTNLDPQIQA